MAQVNYINEQEIDPLKMALRCRMGSRKEFHNCKSCPYSDPVYDPDGEYACDVVEILDAALARIENQEAELRDPLRMLADTLVLRSNAFLHTNRIGDDRARIAAQIAKGDGVVVVPSYFDVMFVPKGTTVSIEDCIKKPE